MDVYTVHFCIIFLAIGFLEIIKYTILHDVFVICVKICWNEKFISLVDGHQQLPKFNEL